MIPLEIKDLWYFNETQIEKYLRDGAPFEDYGVLKAFANKVNLKLVTFKDVYNRNPNHPYEYLDFQEQMAEGKIPRIKESPVKEISEIHKQFLNTEEGKRMFNKENSESDTFELDNISKAVSGSHYNDVIPGYQYMELMQYMLADKQGVESHLLGQVYKYLMRAGKKDDVEQEYRKARWYLNCLVKYKQSGKIDPTNND